VVQGGCAEAYEDLTGAGPRFVDILVAKDLGAAVLVDPDRLHRPIVTPSSGCYFPSVTLAELKRLAGELGIDVIGAAPAEPYEDTERHIRERRSRGLFADMRFTMAQPEVSCHPESLLPGVRTVVSAALSYYAPGPRPAAGEGRLPRYTWSDTYEDLRAKLAQLGERLGGDYRVLVDENQHVDREGAARAGVGFYGKNTVLITRGHGSWVVLGTLVTEAEVEASAPLELDCGSCTRCIDACPTGALDEPGVLDSTRCLSYWTQAPGAIPDEYREELGVQVYGCDICQDVCPWNRGTEKRRSGEPLPAGAEPVVSLLEWLQASDEELRGRYDRLYFPRNDPRYLRRNALVAAGNSREPRLADAVREHAEGDDALLREHAHWALERLSRA
jgi:epoxyqueuosine reductase